MKIVRKFKVIYEWFPFQLEWEWQIKLSQVTETKGKIDDKIQKSKNEMSFLQCGAFENKLNPHHIHNPFIFQRTVKSLNNFYFIVLISQHMDLNFFKSVSNISSFTMPFFHLDSFIGFSNFFFLSFNML